MVPLTGGLDRPVMTGALAKPVVPLAGLRCPIAGCAPGWPVVPPAPRGRVMTHVTPLDPSLVYNVILANIIVFCSIVSCHADILTEKGGSQS